MNQFEYNSYNNSSIFGVSDALKLLFKSPYPVIVCVGSDLAIGDALGPIVGSELINRLNGKAYVYGTLESPITAKEIETVYKTINLMHPKSQILVIDAAIGNSFDVGTIKIKDCGIKPGLGINKDLALIGDVSIIGIVSDKEMPKDNLYNETRFSLIKKLSNVIVGGILEYFK